MEQITIIRTALKADVPLLLEGHTGTGKTYTIMELAKELGKTLHVINVSGELTVDSILGQQTLLDGTVHWRDGVLTQAMKQGDWVLFDEMNTALPEVLTVINGVLDDSRSITLPNADNERVEAHKEFRFIGTQNPSSGQYAGTGRLNDALLNRMIKVTVDYMRPAQEVEALKKHTNMADNSIMGLVDVAVYTRRNGYENPISTRDLVKILRLRDAGKLSIRDAISYVLRDKYSDDEYERIYDHFSDKVREIGFYSEFTDEDPMEHIKKEFNKLKAEREAIEVEKADLRKTVKQELLNDLLGGSGTTVPKDF